MLIRKNQITWAGIMPAMRPTNKLYMIESCIFNNGIPVPCESTFTAPRQKNMVPSVATMEGIPNLTINTELIKPASIPMRRPANRATKIFWVSTNTLAKTQAEIASTEGKERSISPKIIMGVKASTIIPIKGMVDIKEE